MLVGPFGATWAPKGLYLGSLWHPFGSLGMPVGPFGTPLPSGAWMDFEEKMDVLFREYLELLRCLRIKSDLALFSRGSRGSPRSTQSGARAQLPTPLHSRRGLGMARMTVVEHTPSNKMPRKISQPSVSSEAEHFLVNFVSV